MPVIEVKGLPRRSLGRIISDFLSKTSHLGNFCDALRTGVGAIRYLKITPDDVSCFFPKDSLKKGLGEEIIVYVFGLTEKDDRDIDVQNCVAKVISELVIQFYPKAMKVECFVNTFNPNTSGFCCLVKESSGEWSSK